MKLGLLLFIGLTLTMTEALLGWNGGERVSYRPKNPLRWLADNVLPRNKVAKPHKKRYFGLPKGTSLGVKWGLIMPFKTYTMYKASAILSLPMNVPLPDYLFAEYQKDVKPRNHRKQDHYYDPLWQSRRRRAAREERTSFYKYLQAAFDKLGFDGTACVLRTICDIAEAPIENGLLGDMLNILLTASPAGVTEFPWEDPSYHQYLEAEVWGRGERRV